MFCFWEEVCLKDGAKTVTRVHNPKQQYVSRLLYMHICIFVSICKCKGRCAHICTWQLGLLCFCVLISFEWRLIAQKAERWTLPAFNGCLAAAVHFFPQISVSSAKSCNDNLFHHCIISSLSGRSQMHRIGKKLLWQFKTALSVEVCQVHCWAWFLLLNI